MENKEIKIIPRHLAIIPDGNRRWAKQRDKDPWEGHREGAKTTEILIKRANEMGIECLSFWGSSQDNLKKRPLEEKKALLEIYLEYFHRILESDEVHKNEARVNIIGEWEEQFPTKLKNVLKDCIQNTKHYSKRMLNFFLAYNGDREMLQAIQKIISQGIHPENITSEIIKQNLFTRELPAVDYLVRTGGEPHLSTGFMMWDVANAQLHFSQKLYPDFKVKEFEEAIEDFAQRKRRLGA